MGREEAKVKERELIYSQSGNEKFFTCKEEPIHNVHVTIKFPVKGAQLESIFQAERHLGEAGIQFDTGYGCGVRDWSFDWSLKGAYVKLQRVLNEQEQLEDKLYKHLRSEPNYINCQVMSDYYGGLYIVINGSRTEEKQMRLLRKLESIGCEPIDMEGKSEEPLPSEITDIMGEPEKPPNFSDNLFMYGDHSVQVAYTNDKRYDE